MHLLQQLRVLAQRQAGQPVKKLQRSIDPRIAGRRGGDLPGGCGGRLASDGLSSQTARRSGLVVVALASAGRLSLVIHLPHYSRRGPAAAQRLQPPHCTLPLAALKPARLTDAEAPWRRWPGRKRRMSLTAEG